MSQYRYQALNSERQPVAGELAADGLAQAVAQLEAQGLTVLSIVDAAAGRSSAAAAMGPDGENPFAPHSAAEQTAAEQTALRQHMEQVIERGKVLTPPLRAYAAEMPFGRRRRELEAVLRVLDRGDAAAATTALAALPGYWIPLLSAATTSRDPGRVLREFLQESERALELSRQWWRALAYPAILLGLAAAVMTLLSFLVIPIFRDIFQGFGLKLPELTLATLTVAEWITSGRILVALLVVAVLAVLLVRGCHLLPPTLRDWVGDRWSMLWGRSTAIARLAQFTADLLEAELSPAHALRLAGMATNRGAIKRAAWRVASQMERAGQTPGQGPLAEGLAQRRSRRLLSATVLHALQTPAPTLARVRLLREISDCHADRVRLRLSWTRGIVEPIAIVVIGVIVGATVVALFLPLFKLIQGLS